MQTASYGFDNTWRLELDKDGAVCASGAVTDDNTKYNMICTLCKDIPFNLYCLDSYGDGWESPYGGDEAYVEIGGMRYCDENFESGYSLQAQMGTITKNCVAPTILNSDGNCVEVCFI